MGWAAASPASANHIRYCKNDVAAHDGCLSGLRTFLVFFFSHCYAGSGSAECIATYSSKLGCPVTTIWIDTSTVIPQYVNVSICVCTRTVWHKVFDMLRRPDLAPAGEVPLTVWWSSLPPMSKQRRDLHTLLELVLWETWKHRNAVVFDGAAPSAEAILARVAAEGKAWFNARLMKKGKNEFLVAANRRWTRAE